MAVGNFDDICKKKKKRNEALTSGRIEVTLLLGFCYRVSSAARSFFLCDGETGRSNRVRPFDWPWSRFSLLDGGFSGSAIGQRPLSLRMTASDWLPLQWLV